MTLNELAAECHADNIKWWQDPQTQEPIKRDDGELFMLMVSELAEAMEGERKNLMDTHLTHRKMAEVELVDCLIRIFDWAGARNCDLDEVQKYIGYLPGFLANKAAELFSITSILVTAGKRSMQFSSRASIECLVMTIMMIRRYAEAHGYDLDGAYQEKRAYNKQRADHSHEARLQADGKKF